MQRYLWVTVILFAIVAIEGCRRGGRVARPPILIENEQDFLLNESRRRDETAKPKRQIQLGVEHAVQEFPDGVFDPNVEIKWGEAEDDKAKSTLDLVKKKYEAAKENNDRNEQKKYVKRMGELFIAFCNETDPPQRTYDRFRQYVRRTDGDDWRRKLDDKQIEVSMEAEPRATLQFIAYATTSIKETHVLAYIGAKRSPNDPQIELQKKDRIEDVFTHQRLYAIQRAYVGYLVEKAPRDRDYDSLKEFIKKNTVPSAYEAHEKKEILLLDPAKLPAGKEKAATIAALAREDPLAKSHMAVTYKGGITAVPAPLPPTFIAK